MAYFAVLWKARTIEKCRLKYEKEKTKSMLASCQIQQNSWFQKFTLYRCNTQKRISSTFKKMYPEGSAKSIFFIYLKTDQTFPNFVVKSVVGFIGGIILTYICFIFFVYQLSISLIHATVMSSIIGVLLTLGLAFSYRIRCLVFLLIPQFFSRVGRYSLTCYALVLILTGPATNTLKNSEVLSESMACRQEQIKLSTCQITEATKKPLNAMKDSLGVMMERLNLIAMKMKKTIITVQRLVMSVESLINLSFTWLEAEAKYVNKTLKTPYERCVHVLEDGADNCRKYLGAGYWACNTPYVAEASCGSVKPYRVFCSVSGSVDGLMASVRKKLKTFTERLRTIFAVEIHIHHSYSFSSNASRTASQVAAGIVTEIRNRADPLLTWLSWSSCVTSLFLLLIIFRAKYYQHMYETRSRFDNRYITKELRQLDLDRQRQGRGTVLPLNRRERAKYVTTTSFRLVSSEKVHLSRSAVFMVITTLKLLIHMIADYSLYWVLMTIRYHGRFQTALPAGIQNVGVQVSGNGFVAGLLKSIVGTLNIPLTSSMLSPASCLPMPYPPDFRRYSQIGILIFLLWFFALFEPYGLRLRHIIMRHYRPERAKARAIWLYNHLSRTQASFMKFSRRKLHREYFYTSEAKHMFRRWVNDRIRFKWLQVLLGTCEIPHCLLCGFSGKSFRTDTKLIRCKTPKCPGTYCASCFTDIGQLCTICLTPKDYGDLSDESLEKGSSDDDSDFHEGSPPTYSGENSSSIDNDYHQHSKESGKNNTRLYTKSSANNTKEIPLNKNGQNQSSHKISNIKTKFKTHCSKLIKKSNTDSHKAVKSRNIIIRNNKKKKKHGANIKINECMNRKLKPEKQFPINRLFHRLKTVITARKRKRKPIKIKVPFSISVEKFIRSRYKLHDKPMGSRKTSTKMKEGVRGNTTLTRSGRKLRRKRPQRNDHRIFLDVGESNKTNIKTTNKNNFITCSHSLTICKDNDSTDQNKTNGKEKNKTSSKENDKDNEKQEPVKERFEKETVNKENADKFKKTSNSKNVQPNNKTDSHKSFNKISFLFKYWKGCITNIISCTDCLCSEVVGSDENKSFKNRKKEVEPQAENSKELKTSPDKEAIENARNDRISAFLAEQQWGMNDEDTIDYKNKSDSATSKDLERFNWKTEDDTKIDSITATNSLRNCVVNLQWDRIPESAQNCKCGNGNCQCLESMPAILEENSMERKDIISAPQYQAKSRRDNHNGPQAAVDKEMKKAIKQRRGPLLAIRQLCSNLLTVSSTDGKSQVEKKRLNNASKGVLVYPITNSCGCQHSNNNSYSKDQCIQVRLCRSENNVFKTTKCLCDTGVSAVNKTCTCATQNFKVKKDGSFKMYKGHTKCHRDINAEARSRSADRRYSWFEENLTKEKYHMPSTPTAPESNKFQKQVEVAQSLSSITQSLSSIFSDGTRTDTTVCSIATMDYRDIKARKRVRIVTKANQATTTEQKRVCDVSTTTDDWWSPLIERRDKDLYLEKKRGGHVLQTKGDRVHFHEGREKGKEKRYVFKHSTGVATDKKLVTFRSRAQIIPADMGTADILSPSRYLLESQKYYNELFSSKFCAPHVFPATQVKRSTKRRNPGYTTENLKKHRNRTSIHSVKKYKVYKMHREGMTGKDLRYQRGSVEGINFC